jgi:hypothetical protein
MAKKPKKSQALSEAKHLGSFSYVEPNETAEILRYAQDDRN